MTAAELDPQHALGRSPERLNLAERHAWADQFIALEIYTPKDLPLRRIEAIGDTAADCIRQLVQRGLDPVRFEISRLGPPY